MFYSVAIYTPCGLGAGGVLGKQMLSLIFFGALLWCLGMPASARANSLVLDDLVVDNSNGTMTVHYGVRIDTVEPIRIALKQGLRLRFTGAVSLYKKRSLWWDESLADNVFVCDLWEDALTQEGVLRWDTGEIRFPIASLAEHLHAKLHRLTTPIGPWSLIHKGNIYRVRLRLSLGRVGVPVWIRVPLFFWSWDLVPDNTFHMEFSY